MKHSTKIILALRFGRDMQSAGESISNKAQQ